MYNNGKSNKVLWNVETDRLHEIAYEIFINDINHLNDELFKKGDDKRCSYQTLSDFLIILNHNKNSFDNVLDKANILIRKDKIDKIRNVSSR